MRQQELQQKEEVQQKELQQKEEVFQQKLQKREEVRQRGLQQKEEVRQQELQKRKELRQQKLQKREEVRQKKLQEEEELASLVKLRRVLALKISSLVGPGSYRDAHIAEILNLYIQTQNNERKLKISAVLEFYRILPEQVVSKVRHSVESHNSLAREDVIQDEAFIDFVQKFPHLFSIVGKGGKTVIDAIVDGKRPNNRNLSFSAYSCGYSSLMRSLKDPRFTIIPYRICMILNSRIGTASWGGYSTSIDVGVGINVEAQVEVGVGAGDSNGSRPMQNEEVRSITQIISNSDVVKNAEQEPLQAIGMCCTSPSSGKVNADARGRVMSVNMIGKTDGFDYSYGHKVACDDSDDELEELVFYNTLDMPSYSSDSYLGKKARPEVLSPSPLPGPTTYSLRHYYIPINQSSSSTNLRLSSSSLPSLLLPSSSSFFSPKVAPSPASHPTRGNDDRNPGTEEDDEMIHIKGKRRRGMIMSLNSSKETENNLLSKKSLSQNCLATKRKRCRAFDLELGDVEDADELYQMGAERKD